MGHNSGLLHPLTDTGYQSSTVTLMTPWTKSDDQSDALLLTGHAAPDRTWPWPSSAVVTVMSSSPAVSVTRPWYCGPAVIVTALNQSLHSSTESVALSSAVPLCSVVTRSVLRSFLFHRNNHNVKTPANHWLLSHWPALVGYRLVFKSTELKWTNYTISDQESLN